MQWLPRSSRGLPSAVATAAFLCVAAASPPASAHEFWLEPGPVEGTELPLRLFVGEGFAGEELGWESARALTFRAHTTAGVTDLAGEEGAAPAAFLALGGRASLRVIEYVSRPSAAVIPASTFNGYLADHAFFRAIEARAATHTVDSPGRERFTRYCKTILIDASGGSDVRADARLAARPLGHRLEIVPTTNPVRWAREGGPFCVRVLFEGRPLSGAVVHALSRADADSRGAVSRTDERGEARFALSPSALARISVVHLLSADAPQVDWESFWASVVLSPSMTFSSFIP